jgi:hypothetical protein
VFGRLRRLVQIRPDAARRYGRIRRRTDDFEDQLDAATNLGNYASYYLEPYWVHGFSLDFGPIGQ